MAGAIFSVLRLTALLSGPIRRLFLSLPCPSSASTSSDEVEALEEDLEKLGRTLGRIQAVLFDAEERRIRDDAVRLWLRGIRGLAHDADDVVDEFELAVLRHRVDSEALSGEGKGKQEVGKVPHLPGPLENPSFRRELVGRIRRIRERSDEIEAARSSLRLREEDGVLRRAEGAFRPPPAAAHVDKSCAFGRDGHVDEVVGMLLSPGSQEGGDNVSVVAVLGTDGIGKTTLAQLVLADQRVEGHFEVKAWVWASPDFDVTRLTREIVESVTGAGCDLDELSALQEVLDERVAGKKLLLVLDDVWNESHGHWEVLTSPFLGAAEGSRILITTPSKDVARASMAAAPTQQHQLQGLPDAAAWSLFCHHAFGGPPPQTPPWIAEVGREICRRCRGFPLTVRTIAEVLRNETDEQRWEEILASETWDLEGDVGKALSTLELGYHDLPAPMKLCFRYCAVLPRDSKFRKDQLVRMWVAQGFVFVQPTDTKRAEEIAGEHFEGLLQRSFFQQVSDYRDSNPRFVMHDLVHHLAQSVWGEESYREEDPIEACRISRHHCHSTVICNKLEAPSPPCEASYDPAALRTLILKCRTSDILHPHFLHNLLQMLRDVRVLDLSGNNIFELPDSIVGMKHLRYLGLNGTNLTRLPEAMCGLHLLQTLELRHCYRLVELPRNSRYLINLRHLDLHCSANLLMMPRGLGKLTSIQTLPIFVVGREDRFTDEEGNSRCGRIGELGDMNDLRGELRMSGLQNVLYGKFDAREARMKEKKHLEKLHLDWSGEDRENSDLASERDQDVLESLLPHTNIRELEIFSYKGLTFPAWMGSKSFTKLGKVTLTGCRKCKNISPLGMLPALRSLDVREMDGVRRVGREFFGDGGEGQPLLLFPSLEVLGLHDMAEWEEWACWAEWGGEFPRLRRLTIRSCPKLVSLSLHNLRALRWLEARGCKELSCISCFGSGAVTCLEKLEVMECPRLGERPLSSTLGRRVHLCKCPSQRKRSHDED